MSTELIPLAEAEKFLGMGNLPYDKDRVHKNCDILVECATENEEAEKIPLYYDARFICLNVIGEAQLVKTGQFHLESPLADACDRCKGVGRMLKREMKEIEVGCHDCGGEGGTKEECPACNGTRRHVRKFPGLTISVNCTQCDNNGAKIAKCEVCRGSAKVKKSISTGKFASSSQCKSCKGTGKKPPKKPKRIFHDDFQSQLAGFLKNAANVK